MKIGLVSPYDYTYPGGVLRHIIYLKQQFVRMGHQVKILAPCSNKAAIDDPHNVIPIGRALPIPSSGSIVRTSFSPLLVQKVKTILKEENFDILHVHEPLWPSLALAALSLSSTINVGTFHAYHDTPWAYRCFKPLLKRSSNKLHGRIAVSEVAKEFVSQCFPGDYRIIPNGVDFPHFSAEVPPIEGLGDNKLNILFVGRLERRKGFGYLLKAYEKVRQSFPDLRLIVVGPGSTLRWYYERVVKIKRLADVIFTGYVSHADLPRYYHSADIFCAPATGKESFGMVLLEAMAAGKPVVASNIRGYAGVVTHGSEGLLVPPEDAEALAQALAYLLNDRMMRQQLGTRGREKAKEYSWEYIAQRVIDYYEELPKLATAR